MNRKIIQISSGLTLHESVIVALCNDGTLWNISSNNPMWLQLPRIPQDEKPEKVSK